MQRNDWDSTLMAMAYLIAGRSPDPSTKVGCVIVDDSHTVLSMGYNGWPRGVAAFADDDTRYERPEKLLWMEHAERNALYNAGRTGATLTGSHLYTTLFPCADCARGIVQSGVREVVYHKSGTELMLKATCDTWGHSYKASTQMFAEAGVLVRAWDGLVVIPQGLCRGTPMYFCPNCRPAPEDLVG